MNRSRAIRWCLFALAVVAPSAATAQSTTLDGVIAITRGDYETAVRVLRPLAEETSQADPVAQFFMATLYESGRGVPLSQFHACSLYRAAAVAGNPLMEQSRELANNILVLMGSLGEQFCPPFAFGMWSTIPSVSFTLGRDHSVTIGSTGVSVKYNGVEQHRRST